jgi:hypothetical protein
MKIVTVVRFPASDSGQKKEKKPPKKLIYHENRNFGQIPCFRQWSKKGKKPPK